MSINEGLWSAKLPNGDVRSGTLQQLSEAFRAGHIAESTLVCAAGSANWIRLADVLGSAAAFATAAAVVPSQPPAFIPQAAAPPQAVAPTPPPPASVSPSTNGSHGLWQVKLPTGAVRSGSRQQLEEALRAGHLDENALALPPGASEWSKVGALLRGGQPPPASMPPSVRPPPVSVAPPPRPSPASLPSSASSASPGFAAPVAPPLAAPAPPPKGEGNDALWQLRLANGQVRSGTRRQLEDAFNAGHLDESEMVLPAGSSEWVRLGEVMDRRPLAPLPPPGMSPAPMPVVAAEPPPVVAAESAPIAAAEPGPAVAAEAAPMDAGPAPASTEEGNSRGADAAPSKPATDAATSDAKDTEEVWQVKLTLKQLEEAFLAGLLDDETLVLSERENEWLPLREFRSAQPPPFGSGLVAGGPHQAEPASRTEPWPANAGIGNSPSPASEVD